jgi:hypothetical protein
VIEQTAEFIFGSWGAPEIPVGIEYPLEVMDEIRGAATDGLQRLARGGLEVGGVLFGVRRDTGIRILTWRPILCEYAMGPTLTLSERDRAELTLLIDSASVDSDLKGLQSVGWFISHTRSGVSLSPQDLAIFDRFFPEPWQVTLVLHPSQAGVARAGFFVRDSDGSLKSDSSPQEFTVNPLHRASRPLDPSTPAPKERSNSRLKPEPVIAPVPARPPINPSSAAVVEPPLFRTLERSKTPPAWLWVLTGVLGLIVAGFLVKQRYLAQENESFPFHVYEAGNAVQIEWDQNAAPIRNAHLGAIDIIDGGETKRYPLADEALHSGKMTYVRRGGDLELRITVYPVDFQPVQEFAYLLEPRPPAPATPPPELQQLRDQRDQLQAEVNKLTDELRKERAPTRRRRR